MPVEVITTILAAVTMLLSLAGGFAWMITHFDRQLGQLDTKLSGRIDRVEAGLSRRIDDVEANLSGHIDRVGSEVTEIKVTIARWEGPARPPLLLRK